MWATLEFQMKACSSIRGITRSLGRSTPSEGVEEHLWGTMRRNKCGPAWKLRNTENSSHVIFHWFEKKKTYKIWITSKKERKLQAFSTDILGKCAGKSMSTHDHFVPLMIRVIDSRTLLLGNSFSPDSRNSLRMKDLRCQHPKFYPWRIKEVNLWKFEN